ncbi:MAG: amino acid ABC transporter substrate-binding protein [Azoarcus sp.]|nr:amino acid ABC transporter substrate-binding protein [Azoarcus sp.]
MIPQLKQILALTALIAAVTQQAYPRAGDNLPNTLLAQAPVSENNGTAAAPQNAPPDHSEETIKKISRTRTINIGYREASRPLSYLDISSRPIGYGKEICDYIANAVKQELKMPEIKIVYFSITSSNRIPMLQNGTIDMECSSTSITQERKKLVDFSIPYFVANLRLMTRKDYHFKTLNDLSNKTIIVTAGTTAEKIIDDALDTHKHNITVIKGREHADSFMMVKSGYAAAYAIDDVLLAAAISSFRDPNAYELIGPSLNAEFYGVMFRKDEPQFKKIVNETLIRLMKSGEAEKLYSRWFMKPIPPFDRALNIPMSDQLIEIFAHPEAQTDLQNL